MLNGFEKNGTIPVNFPIDICLFEVKNIVFAAALHHQSQNIKNDTFLTIYKQNEVIIPTTALCFCSNFNKLFFFFLLK